MARTREVKPVDEKPVDAAEAPKSAVQTEPESGPVIPTDGSEPTPDKKARKKYERETYPGLFDRDGKPRKLKAWPSDEWVETEYKDLDSKERDKYKYSTARHNLLRREDFESPLPFLEHQQASLEKRLADVKAEIVQVRELGGDTKKIKAAEKMRKMLEEAEAIRQLLADGGTDVDKLLNALKANEDKKVVETAENSAEATK